VHGITVAFDDLAAGRTVRKEDDAKVLILRLAIRESALAFFDQTNLHTLLYPSFAESLLVKCHLRVPY
jgi:hypothetical protein